MTDKNRFGIDFEECFHEISSRGVVFYAHYVIECHFCSENIDNCSYNYNLFKLYVEEFYFKVKLNAYNSHYAKKNRLKIEFVLAKNSNFPYKIIGLSRALFRSSEIL